MVETRATRKAAASTNISLSNGYSTSSEKSLKRPLDDPIDEPEITRPAKLASRTDYSRWRMLDEKGRQTWHYLDDDEKAKEWPQTTADKYFLGLSTVRHP